MKNIQHTIALVFLSTLMGIVVLSSCTKEGPPGAPGIDGEDGKDGAMTCSACHNVSELLNAKISQYENSGHASATTTNRSNEGCSQCHTSMGFRNFIADSTLGAIADPTPINCRTCHPIHESFTTEDFLLRTVDSVRLSVGDIYYDYQKSNLCVNCHQARPVNPYPDLNSKDSLTLTSSHYGPHHATQANMFTSTGPIEISGSMPYLNSAHKRLVDGGCVTCHMSPATGVIGGGHQMGIKYDYNGSEAYQYTGCIATDCHGSATEVAGMIDPNRAEIVQMEEELKELLIEKELLDYRGLVVPQKVSPYEAAAIVNYKFVEGDHSSGAHNFRYTKALLVNTIEYLQK